MLSEEKNEEINKLTKKVNDLFRERNYFKTIMDDCSHGPKEEVYSENDEDQKYKDGTDFFYPLIDEYERGTIYKNSEKKECPIPKPDAECDDEYRDFMSLIDHKKEEGSELFFDPRYEDEDYQISFKNSEDKPLELRGDRLFHFNQLVGYLCGGDREKAFSRLKDDSLQTLINTFTKASALSGSYIFWRNAGRGKGINSLRSTTLKSDRFDLALVALREWFTDDDDARQAYEKNKYTLLVAFNAEEDAGYPFFLNKGESRWKDFVNFFELKGSFVDDDYRVYNQVSNPFEEEMEVFPDKNKDWDGKLKKSWSDPKHDGGIPPEIENYLINGIKTIIKRTERLNEVLHRA